MFIVVAGIDKCFIFKGIPASPSLRSAVESRLPHFKNRAVGLAALFSCGFCNYFYNPFQQLFAIGRL